MPDPNMTRPTTAAAKDAFVAVLPRILLHARISFRHVP